MAGGVYRLPPVAQWYQPHAVLDGRSVDSPDPQPLPKVVHLRRRHDFETEQQPRHLLDVSVITTVDAPVPLPTPPVVNLRDRHEYETLQQPRRLLDVAVTQSVDSPPGLVLVQLAERAGAVVGRQARGLPVDVLAPVVVADNPTGNIVQALVFRPYEWQPWLQLRSLPVDITAPVVTPDNPTGNVTQAIVFRSYPRESWQQARALDVSVTQGVDSPPGFGRQQPFTPPAGRGAQWDQAVPGNFDIAATVPFTVQAFTQPPRPDRAPWLQARPLDVSVTQSVDSPPGYFRHPVAPTRPGSGAQWRQAAPGQITAPDAPNPTFNPWVYARQAAETQAWQKTKPVLHLVTVESPPLSGPYPTAPYRRPRYTPPVPMPAAAGIFAPAVAPAPILLSPLTTVAVLDGRTTSGAVIDGMAFTVGTADGQTRTVAVVDGELITVAIVDGRRRET